MPRVRRLLWLLLLLTPLVGFAQATREEASLRGPVKSARVVTAQMLRDNDRWTPGEAIPTESYVYTREGKLEEILLFDDKGNAKLKVDYTYDAEGRLTEEVTWDAGNRVVSCRNSAYDALGQLVKENTFQADGHLSSRKDLAYDAQGRKLKETFFGANNAVLWQWTYTYNDRGNLLKVWKNAGDNNGLAKTAYGYDAAGRTVQESEYSADGALQRQSTTIYTFPNSKACVDVTYGADGNALTKSTCYYDGKSNLVARTEYYQGQIVRREQYTYEFDKQGNWIKRTTLCWTTRDDKSAFEPTTIISRTISYY